MFESIVVIVSFMVLIGSVIFFFNYIDSDDPPAQKPLKTKDEWATMVEERYPYTATQKEDHSGEA